MNNKFDGPIGDYSIIFVNIIIVTVFDTNK